MRVAIEASTWVNRRGYGRFTRELVQALVRNPGTHSVTLVLDSGAAAASDLPDVPQTVVATRRSVVSAAAASTSRSPLDLLRMSRSLSSPQFDAVVFPTLYSYVPVWSRARVLVVIHDALPEQIPDLVLGSFRARLLWRLKARLACWQADALATVSQASAREIRARLPIGKKRLSVLTEGAAAVFSPVTTPDDSHLVSDLLPRGRIVLYVGGLSAHKRVPDLVRAFGELATRPDGEDLLLVLAGPDVQDGFTSGASDVDCAIGQLGRAAERVVRTGFVPDATLAALYRSALCVVLPSLMEGFGLPAIEAMASGTPVVVARTGALEEVCGDAAEYFDAASALGPAIARVIEDRQRRDRLRSAGLHRANSFGWDRSARLIREALAGGSIDAGCSAR